MMKVVAYFIVSLLFGGIISDFSFIHIQAYISVIRQHTPVTVYHFPNGNIKKRFHNFLQLFSELENEIMTGHPHTLESRAKISAANKGKIPWNIGKQHSEETKKRIGEKTREAMLKQKLKKATDMGLSLDEYKSLKVTRKKERQKKKVKTGLTIEGRQRMSDSAKKRWQDPDYRQNYTLHLKGCRNHSEATRVRISEAIKLKWKDSEYRTKLSVRQTFTSEDTRKKISATLKAKWEDPEFRIRMTSNFTSRSAEWRAAVSLKIKEKWNDPEYRLAVTNGIKRTNAALNNGTGTSGGRRGHYNLDTISQLAERKKRKDNAIKSKNFRESSKYQLIDSVKRSVRENTLNGRKVKDMLGSEIWFEEKLKRKKEGAPFLDDFQLELRLLDEWSNSASSDTIAEDEDTSLTGMNIVRGDGDDSDGEDNRDDRNDDFYFDDDDEGDDVIEVYDETGELIGTYSEAEFERIRHAGK